MPFYHCVGCFISPMCFQGSFLIEADPCVTKNGTTYHGQKLAFFALRSVHSIKIFSYF